MFYIRAVTIVLERLCTELIKGIIIVVVAYILLSLIPTQKFMYEQTPICKTGTATTVGNKVVCQ